VSAFIIRCFDSHFVAGIPWLPTEELAFGELIQFWSIFVHHSTLGRLFVMGSGIKLSPMGEPLEMVCTFGFTYQPELELTDSQASISRKMPTLRWAITLAQLDRHGQKACLLRATVWRWLKSSTYLPSL
jgi:hypothetical protein